MEFNSIGDYFLIALVGFALVFAVLIVLMFIIQITSMIIKKAPEMKKKKTEIQEAADAAMKADADEKGGATAVGTCGELLLVKTSERDAAMIMAIVADSMETPLNELRFKKITKLDQEGER